MSRIVLVTGGYGFIGREVVLQLWHQGHHIVVVDSETYAARPHLLPPLPRVARVRSDIRDLGHIHGIDTIIHCAAETHVDNAIDDPHVFLETNVLGTFRILERIRAKRAYERPQFIHVSTDEVYGDVAGTERSLETDRLLPSSPYSASKAAAEMCVLAWARTYDLSARVVRPSNCYGFSQFSEKLIPKALRYLQLGRPIPIHGDGSQTRSWLQVEDCARAILHVMDHGMDGEAYNVPGDTEASVADVARRIVYEYSQLTGAPMDGQVAFGQERPGGDTRYAVNGDKLKSLGWRARHQFWEELPKIVRQEVGHGVHVSL